MGIDDYLTKPFKADDLLKTVKVRIDKYKKQNEKIIHIKNNISKYIPHELRTPLGVIIGFSDLILEAGKDISREEVVEMVQRIKKSSQRLHSRIEKLILLTEIDIDLEEKNDKGSKLREQVVCEERFLEAIISDTIAYHDRTNDVSIKFERAELYINEFYFKRLIIELLDNALKFSSKSESVSLIGKKRLSNYEITVKDHGFGMGSEEINNLTPFTQFNREKYQQEGNGLGIYIVNKIVKLFEGECEFLTSEQEGIIVRIKLKYTV